MLAGLPLGERERPRVWEPPEVLASVQTLERGDLLVGHIAELNAVEYLPSVANGLAQVLVAIGLLVGLLEVFGVGYELRPQPLGRGV